MLAKQKLYYLDQNAIQNNLTPYFHRGVTSFQKGAGIGICGKAALSGGVFYLFLCFYMQKIATTVPNCTCSCLL